MLEAGWQKGLRTGFLTVRLEMPGGIYRPYWPSIEDTYVLENDFKRLFALAGIREDIRIKRVGKTSPGNGRDGIFLGEVRPFMLNFHVQYGGNTDRDVWQWLTSYKDMDPLVRRLTDALEGKEYIPLPPQPPPSAKVVDEPAIPSHLATSVPDDDAPLVTQPAVKKKASSSVQRSFCGGNIVSREPLGAAYCLALLIAKADAQDLVLKELLTEVAQDFFDFSDKRGAVPLHRALVLEGYLIRHQLAYQVKPDASKKFVHEYVTALREHPKIQERMRFLGYSTSIEDAEALKRLSALLEI